MAVLEIFLSGLLLVAIYLVADAITVRIERWRDAPLGTWRSVLFFGLFLGMLLISQRLLSRFIPELAGASP
jgi:uncharacterized membrane protein YhaH (DUF805 family)